MSVSDVSSMIARKRRRVAFGAKQFLGAVCATALALAELRDNILYFWSPSDAYAKHVAPGTAFRVGGLVERRSVRHFGGTRIGFT